MENEVVNKVQPPNDTLSEQAVIGSMLVSKDAVQTAVEVLKPEDFYREDNCVLEEHLKELVELKILLL